MLRMKTGILFAIAISYSVMSIPSLAHASAHAPVHAPTHIPGGIIDVDTVWDADHSPYLIDGSIDIPLGHTLTIKPGVVIDTELVDTDRPMISVDGGTLDMRGTEEMPIVIAHVWDLDAYQATATLSHVRMSSVEGGLSLYESDADIRYSSFEGARNAIQINGGTTTIASSSLSGFADGLYIQNIPPVLMMAAKGTLSTSAASSVPMPATAFAPDPYSAIVSVSNSSFPSTTSVAIDNSGAKTGHTVAAIGNWWGSADQSAFASRLKGPIDYAPWLDHEPDLIDRAVAQRACCSSVLFIPGIESSRLYRDQKSAFGIGTTTNTLWEPNRNDDVRALFLDAHGSSTDQSIYSGDPIGSAWGYSVYASFMKSLDSLVAAGAIAEWKPFGYDWRKPIDQVALGWEKKATTTVSLIDMVADIARRSKTGKVDIVAHSNGGLVARYLIKALADRGESSLVDTIISVAVPYLGTPEAIGGILHGDDESVADGLLLKTSVARDLGVNMPSAYSLVPSSAYYIRSPGSTISFVSGTPSTINDGAYPHSIASFADMSSFMSDSRHARVHASSSDIIDPIQANASLLASAGALHAALDYLSWPADIARWAIVGWNALTTTGISYGSRERCGLSLAGWSCATSPTHTEMRSNMGDGTVVAQSAIDGSQSIASVNLRSIDGGIGEYAHGNILESSTTQAIIRDIVTNAPTSSLSELPAVALSAPDFSKASSYIVLSTHSPIQPNLYDARGNHTGEISAPADTEDLYHAVEQHIPGSSIEMIPNSDTDYDTYIYIPDDGQKYSLVLDGTGLGGFTFDIDRYSPGAASGTGGGANDPRLVDHAEYAGLPVTPLSVATATIQFAPYAGSGEASASSTFAARLPVLSLDINGDGQTDMQARHDASTTMTAASYLDILKKTCDTLDRHSRSAISYCRDISRRIDMIEDQLRRGKLKHIHDQALDIAPFVRHRDWKKMDDADRTDIGKMIDGFVSQFE
jgi:pimeloyl-ACP methyl ester carboxylesterase